MPALEPDDVVLTRYPDGREEQLRVNAINLPLDPASSMDLTVTGHYSPDTLMARGRARRSFKVFGGAAAWRELESADRVTSS
jgi:hypothetical protein